MGTTAFNNIESGRLVLRRFADEDLAAFLAYLNDPVVARYQSWESYTEQQAREVIGRQKNLEPGTPGQWFTFAAELKETKAVIGHVALSVKVDDPRQAGDEARRTLRRERLVQGRVGVGVPLRPAANGLARAARRLATLSRSILCGGSLR